MNSELKALIKASIDLTAVVKSAVAKEDFVTKILPKIYAVISDVPAVAAGIGDLKSELESLKNAEASADLLAYVLANVAGVTTDAHAQKIISASLVMLSHLIQDGIVLVEAIQSPSEAPALAAAEAPAEAPAPEAPAAAEEPAQA